MALSSTKIGLGGVPYREGENVAATPAFACSFEDMVDALCEDGVEVQTGVILDDGTILLAGND